MNSVLQFLIEPWQPQFMRLAFAAALLAGFNCALVGVLVVLRRLSFLGGALAHTVLPGAVVAWLAGVSVFWGALPAGLASAALMGWLARREGVRDDTAIGIVLSLFFALGLLLMSWKGAFRDFNSLLFGSILGITPFDLALTAAVTLIVGLALALLYKEWKLSTLDPEYAFLVGLRPQLLHYLLLFLVTLAVVSAIQVVGALLATALLILPPATARLRARSLGRMLAFAVASTSFGSLTGLTLAWHLDLSPGACIVLASGALFLLFRLLPAKGSRKGSNQ